MEGWSDGWGKVAIGSSAVMQRSLRSAGVRPVGSMQYHIVRSLVISLAIVLVITRSQAKGFAIQRTENWYSTTDLDTGESSLLEVRYDLEGATHIKALDSVVNAITELSKASDSGYSNNITLNNTVTPAIQVEHNDTTTQQDIAEFSYDGAITTESNVDLTTSTIETRQEININNISTSASVSKISNDIDNKSTSPMIIETSTQRIYENDSTTIEISTSYANTQSSDSFTTDNDNSDITSTVNIDVSDATQNMANNYTQQNTDLQQNTETDDSSTATINIITSEADSLLSGNLNDIVQSQTGIDDEPATETSPPTIESTSNKIDVETSTKLSIVTDTSPSSEQTMSAISTESNYENSTETAPDTTLNVATDTTVTYLESNYMTLTTFAITEDQTEETFKTDALKDQVETTTLPHWKIYKTINRKRPTTTSIEETTSTDIEMTKSETARISLERVLNNTPIPSLVQLKNDLLNAQEYSTKIHDTMNATKTNETDTPVLAKPLSTKQTATELETRTPKLEIVSSQRAGYLDNKKTTTLEPPQLATAFIYEDKNVSNDTENLGTMYETETGDGDISELRYNNNSTGAESQSQLVEDAIKEELLMEKTLNENNLLKEETRQRDSPNPLLGNAQPSQHYVSKTSEITTEDLLSVKPISPDKRKNNPMYLPSAVTYKPLKKLEVQHPKQFVRDPDDNSWRNESISSLGIVFKPKNASKSFTEVLKNKTTELSNMVEKGDKSDVPDLRVRLEKIAEVRKSKKKRINMYGDTVYSDYEESSGENANSSKEDTTSQIVPSQKQDTSTTTPLPPSKTETDLTGNAIWKDKMRILQDDDSTTEKLKKLYNMADYYDATDDYDADYITLSKIDLKRFTIPLKSDKDTYSATRPPDTYTTHPAFIPTKPMRVTYMPDRQPTVQYFPPTKKASTPVTPKVSINEYDDKFSDKVNMYAYNEDPKVGYDVTFATASPVQTKKHEQPTIVTTKPIYTPSYQAGNVHKSIFLTTRPMTEPEPQDGFVPNDGTFNRASYVIKHYKDFINDAAKDNDDEKTSEYLPFTEAPLRGVTMSKIPNFSVQKQTKLVEDDDYDTHFRKDIMTRFVDNFNQNSERFKVEFPILYNNSVVHRKEEQNGKVLASSSALMKRLYETANPRSQFLLNVKPCNANCEALTVDLSPAYELHYYVPDQEEKEEIETGPTSVPYRTYRL